MTIKDISIGKTTVKAIYIGNTQVWGHNDVQLTLNIVGTIYETNIFVESPYGNILQSFSQEGSYTVNIPYGQSVRVYDHNRGEYWSCDTLKANHTLDIDTCYRTLRINCEDTFGQSLYVYANNNIIDEISSSGNYYYVVSKDSLINISSDTSWDIGKSYTVSLNNFNLTENTTVYVKTFNEEGLISIAVDDWSSRVTNWFEGNYDITVVIDNTTYTGYEVSYNNYNDTMVVYELHTDQYTISTLEGSKVTVTISGWVNADWGSDTQTWTGTLSNGQCICT